MKLEKIVFLQLAWLIAFVAMLGSLFFSEILKFPPCVLCWYQRIAIYPLVILLGVAITKNKKDVLDYVYPLTYIGLIIALYQNLLYYKILPESNAPCTFGVSCTTKYIEYFGFITIPLLSLVAFIFLLILFFLYKKQPK